MAMSDDFRSIPREGLKMTLSNKPIHVLYISGDLLKSTVLYKYLAITT